LSETVIINRIGLWAYDNNVTPREYRKNKKQEGKLKGLNLIMNLSTG
jgi:endonuclease YncB( thermonuclease family)